MIRRFVSGRTPRQSAALLLVSINSYFHAEEDAMSNDPLQPPPPPLPHLGEPGYPAPGHDPYTPVFGESSDPKKAKGRLLVPGVLIVLIGILNLVPGIGCTSIGLIMNSFSDAQMEQLVKQNDPR